MLYVSFLFVASHVKQPLKGRIKVSSLMVYEPILITEMWALVLGLGFGAVTNKRDTHFQMIHFHIERRRYRT